MRTARVLAPSQLCFHGSASGFHWSWQLHCDLVITGRHGSQLTRRGGPGVTASSPVILAASTSGNGKLLLEVDMLGLMSV